MSCRVSDVLRSGSADVKTKRPSFHSNGLSLHVQRCMVKVNIWYQTKLRQYNASLACNFLQKIRLWLQAPLIGFFWRFQSQPTPGYYVCLVVMDLQIQITFRTLNLILNLGNSCFILVWLKGQERREFAREVICTIREHSSSSDSNCHQQEVYRDVNMWWEKIRH